MTVMAISFPLDLDVFVENKIVIDEEIFQMWIDGREGEDCFEVAIASLYAGQ